jgi:hypothetical protein
MQNVFTVKNGSTIDGLIKLIDLAKLVTEFEAFGFPKMIEGLDGNSFLGMPEDYPGAIFYDCTTDNSYRAGTDALILETLDLCLYSEATGERHEVTVRDVTWGEFERLICKLTPPRKRKPIRAASPEVMASIAP